MARLVIKSADTGDRVIELNLGVNRLGRSPKNDIPIEHPTVSARHCEIVLTNDGVMVRDCTSAKRPFVDGERIQEEPPSVRQAFHLGEVEVEGQGTEVAIAKPKFDM